jgi:hypothetical protein
MCRLRFSVCHKIPPSGTQFQPQLVLNHKGPFPSMIRPAADYRGCSTMPTITNPFTNEPEDVNDASAKRARKQTVRSRESGMSSLTAMMSILTFNVELQEAAEAAAKRRGKGRPPNGESWMSAFLTSHLTCL